MQTAVISHAGLVRQQNEDSFLMLPEYGFFSIADGMGGHKGGACASNLALRTIKKHLAFAWGKEDLREELSQAVKLANREIYELSNKDPSKDGMGTTLTALWIKDWIAHLAHVGDSRAYLIRCSSIKPLTDDHSLVNELVRHGSLTESEARSHPQKHMLTRALGVEEQIKVDTKSFTLQKGDLLFLCTDGLTNLVNDEEIGLHFSNEKKLQDVLESLMKLAFKRGGLDNITMVAILLK